MVTCVDGPTDAGRFASLAVRPSFQVDPALFPSGPIDRVRLVAIEVATSQVVGTADVAVDPNDTSWSLPLEIDLGGQPSLDVLVEVELFSGATVEWSGRLGPISVGASATPSVRGIDVHRGSLDNLDVTDLAIQGAPGQLNVGGTAVLTAVPTLAAGSTTVPTIYWASSNPAVATVSATGSSVTVTAVSVGSADIVATAGAADDEVAVTVVAVAPPGFDLEWRGTTADWATPSNWSTGQVPQSTDDVFVPAAAAVDPTISTLTQVARLTVETGASVTIAGTGLTVSGDLDARGAIGGAGDVFLTGAGTTVRGTLQIPVQVSGTVAADGALAAQSLTVDGSGASFDVGGQTVTVQTSLRTQAGGVLRSTAGGGSVSTFDAFFLGGSTSGLLTAGELRVQGDFLALTDPASFAAGGTHTVVFEGTQPQVADFSDPGAGTQRFQNVTFDNAAGVSFTSNVVAMGAVQVAAGAVLIGDYTLSLAGSLADPAGGLVFANLSLIGNVSALPAALTGQVTVDASVTWPNDATLTGGLYVPGSLNVGTRTLTVAGDVYADGALTVPTGGALAISGTLSLGSGSTLHVDGTVTGRCVDGGATITGTGTHACGAASGAKQWVGGDAAGPIDWHNPNNWSPPGVPTAADDVEIGDDLSLGLSADAVVHDLLVGEYTYLDLGGFTLTVAGDANVGLGLADQGTVDMVGSGVVVTGGFHTLLVSGAATLAAAANVSGDLLVMDGVLDVAGSSLAVGGALTVTGPQARLVMTQAGSYVSVNGPATFDGGDHNASMSEGILMLLGDLTVTDRSATSFAASANHTTYLSGGAGQVVTFDLPGASQQRFADLYVSATTGADFLTDAHVLGDLLLTGRMSVPANATMTIDGGLTVNSGSQFDVEGVVTAAQGCTNLGAIITGGGTQPCGPPTGVTKTWVGGDAEGPTNWHNSNNWTPVGVPGGADDVLIGSGSSVSLSTDVAVRSLSVGASSFVDLVTYVLDVTGDLNTTGGELANGTVQVVGPGTLLQGTFPNLYIRADRVLSGWVNTTGNLLIEETLDVNGQSVFVAGRMDVQGFTAQLVMTNAASAVYADGLVVFDADTHVGLLTAGTLSVGGDFGVTNRSPTGFAPSGSHTTLLSGTTAQTISFATPGATEQRFANLTIANALGVSLGTNAVVTGSALVTGQLVVPTTAILDIGADLTLVQGSQLHVDGVVNAPAGCVNLGAIITGTGSQPCSPTPPPADRTWVGGDIDGPTSWNNPDNWTPASVPASDESVYVPPTANEPVLSGNEAVASAVVALGATIDLAGFTLAVDGDLVSDGQIIGGLVDLVGPGLVSGNMASLRVSAGRTVAGALTVAADVEVLALLDIAQGFVSVGGDFSTATPTGAIQMADQASVLVVNGTITFDGGSADGLLTSGFITAYGDFVVGNTNSPAAFTSQGTGVQLVGTVQTVTLADPAQTFDDLNINASQVTFTAGARVSGVFYAASATLVQGGGLPLEVSGTGAVVNLDGVTFVGLPLVLVSSAPTSVHGLTDVTFTNMPPISNQLTIDLVGAGAGAPLLIASPVFDTPPVQGGFYIYATNSTQTGQQLVIQLTNPTPAGSTAFFAGALTQINWP